MRYLFFLLTLLAFSNCKTSPDSPSTNLPGSKWKISWYWDKDKEETSNFSGYTFEFKSDGSFVGYLPDGTAHTGTWLAHDNDSKLQIVISGEEHLDKLNHDWILIEQTSSSLKIKDDNTSQNEEMHFVKI